MPTFEILCTTMNQHDFSKLKEMNVHADILYANQASTTRYDELKKDDKTARMITTDTRGVGKNRNIALIYAKADICLFSDDDMVYEDNVEQIVLEEFERIKEADAIIFNVISDNEERKQVINRKSKRMSRFARNPYGAVRIAVKLEQIKRNNIWFSPLFGGGALYPSGEDSLFIQDMRKRGMKIYISEKIIGRVKQESSTWFTGASEKFYYGKGAFIQATRRGLSRFLYIYYFAMSTHKRTDLKFNKVIKSIRYGMKCYKNLTHWDEIHDNKD